MTAAPELRVEAGPVRAAGPGRWSVAWRIANASSEPLALAGARLPHDHFFAEERALAPELALGAGAATTLEVEVACADPPGATVENAFLILRVRAREQTWLAFARLRVVVDERGVPAPSVERLSAQQVGS